MQVAGEVADRARSRRSRRRSRYRMSRRSSGRTSRPRSPRRARSSGTAFCTMMHEHLHDAAEAHAEHHHVAASPARPTCATPMLRQQEHAERHQRGAGDREDPVAAGPADDLARADGDDEQAGHQRAAAAGPRASARLPLTIWKNTRQVGDRAEHREADDEADDARRPRTRGSQNRCSGSTGSAARRSTSDEHPDEHHAADAEDDDRRRAPGGRSCRRGS